MKSRFSLLIILTISIIFSFSSCVKDQITSDLRIVESVSLAECIEFQNEYLLEAIANSWDNQILPFGVTRTYLDTNKNRQKFEIDFGKMQLCGDYISRTGKLAIDLYSSNGKWDSLNCNILPNDSFGTETNLGTIYIYGHFSLNRRDLIQVDLSSILNIYVKDGWKYTYTSNSLVSRIKKYPTQLNLNDGNKFDGKSVLGKENSDFFVSTEIIDVSKPIDAPNFPILGELNCKLISGEIIQVYFDPYTNLNYDKVAKGKFGNTEWFFNFQ